MPRSTLNRRINGIPSQQDSVPKSRILTPLEELVIVRHILNLDSRSFPPRIRNVEDIANRILNDRNATRVGKNWTSNFVQRQLELSTRFNRRIDYQRVLSEDPDAYNAWFRLAQNTINKYGILKEDIYNFDETRLSPRPLESSILAPWQILARERCWFRAAASPKHNP